MSGNPAVVEAALSPGLEPALCSRLQARNRKVVQAIDDLSRAAAAPSAPREPMMYLSLAYREKAHVDCENTAAAAEDTRLAYDWVARARQAKPAGHRSPSLDNPPEMPPPPVIPR